MERQIFKKAAGQRKGIQFTRNMKLGLKEVKKLDQSLSAGQWQSKDSVLQRPNFQLPRNMLVGGGVPG